MPPRTPVHLLDKTITTQRVTYAADAHSAGGVETWAAQLSGIKARIQPMSSSESVRYGRESGRRMVRIYVKPGQDIRGDDRVVWTDGSTTRYLDIVEIITPQDGDTITRLICEDTQ